MRDLLANDFPRACTIVSSDGRPAAGSTTQGSVRWDVILKYDVLGKKYRWCAW